jgi:hypothetical protein
VLIGIIHIVILFSLLEYLNRYLFLAYYSSDHPGYTFLYFHYQMNYYV